MERQHYFDKIEQVLAEKDKTIEELVGLLEGILEYGVPDPAIIQAAINKHRKGG